MKMRVPPSWKSTRNPANFHTVTFLFASQRDPQVNPLCMGEGLEQLLASHCSGCKAGMRTAASCLHRIAGIMVLCGTNCFDSAKVPEPVYLDTARFCSSFTRTFLLFFVTGLTDRYHCSVVHPLPILVESVMFCSKFLPAQHMLSQTGGRTQQENCFQALDRELELVFRLVMISHILTKLSLLQTCPTLTCSSCWDIMASKGSGIRIGRRINSSSLLSLP